MARDHPVRDPRGPGETVDSIDDRRATIRAERGTIGRRSYLKLAGATAAAASVTASVAGASDGEYETIRARGQTIRIDSGETWENKLIDFGDRNNITIVAYGTDWTIRNVGFVGTIPYNETIIGVADTGRGTSTVENVYFGEADGSQPANLRSISIWVNPDHNGTLNVERVNFNVPGNNGIYGSAPGYNGEGGRIHLRNCYGNDCHHTAFRIPDNGSSVTNCVSYKSGTRAANRSAWVWEGNYGGEATFEDCHFTTNGTGGGLVTNGDPNLSLSNVRTDDGYGDAGNPQHFVPEGCPESAEEAATGGTSVSVPDEDLPEHAITFIGKGEATEYYFETTDEIVENPLRGDVQRHDVIDGTNATGWVTTSDHVDSFRFDGDLVEVSFHRGAATVELDGEEIDPDEYAGGEDALENVLLVDGVGTTGGTRYEFAVSGDVEKANEYGATVDDGDAIESSTVTGSVAGWRDAFRFDGDLEELTVDGSVRVLVNDEAIDPADYGEELPHVLTVVGNGTASSYEVSVDGTIDRVPGDDSTESASVSTSTVEGSIRSGVHRFKFSGTVSDVTFIDGSAHVYVDDERIDPDEIGEAELLPHAIVFDGTDADGETTYSFTIDGDVIASNYRDATVDDGDVIEGTSVSGSVEKSIDAYWFDVRSQ